VSHLAVALATLRNRQFLSLFCNSPRPLGRIASLRAFLRLPHYSYLYVILARACMRLRARVFSA